MTLRAPFPWFGGKRPVAHVAWRAFGADVPNYIEPYFGSGAVLFGRPGGAGKIETVNDRDRYLANFWRSIAADPYEVAAYADWPVNEADMHARHKWLVNQHEFRERMHTDPDFYDAKIAGWWVWGICLWIGSGWCSEPNNHKHPKLDGIGKGVHANHGHSLKRQLPDLAIPIRARRTGRGVHSAEWHPRPDLSSEVGVHRKLPHLAVKADGACAGRGIHSHVHLPSLGNDRGIHGVSTRGYSEVTEFLDSEVEAGRGPPAFPWFLALSDRLRRVRVACGDWQRVLGNSILGKGQNVGGRRPCAVFLDAPYSHEFRDPGIYGEDDPDLSAMTREWAIAHGEDPDLRIALCGYEGEHAMPANWTCHPWKARRGYAGAGNDNRSRERIWFSPHCLPLEGGARQGRLFEAMEG